MAEIIFNILSEHICRLRSKKEYELIHNLYNRLLDNNIIHSFEDFKEGKTSGAEETLLYHIYRAATQSWLQTPKEWNRIEFEEFEPEEF